MKKKLMLTLATIVAACMMCSVVFASAGIVQNSPVGTGLISNGAINTASFMIREDTDPSAYSVQNGNSTYEFNAIGWREALIVNNAGIPVTDLVDGAKITIQFDVYSFGAAWTQCAYFSPFASSGGDWTQNHLNFRVNADGSSFQQTGILAGDNVQAQISLDGGDSFTAITLGDPTTNTGFQQNIIADGNDYGTIWIEYDITEKTMSIYAGYAEDDTKTLYSIISNAFTIPDAESVYMNFAMDNSYEIDNYKIYRTLNDEVKTYVDVDFSDASDVLSVELLS